MDRWGRVNGDVVRVNGMGFSLRRCASIISFCDNDGIGFWKSVDTWLTREGELGGRKNP